MANGFDPRGSAAPQPAATLGSRGVPIDAGLRSYMLSVYNYMASGVLLTGIVAMLTVQTGFVNALVQIRPDGAMSPTALGWLVTLAPLGLVFWMSFGINRMAAGTAKVLFWVYAALVGASLSTILLVYTSSSVAQTFFATSAAFASLSLWGYTTKRDLSGWGSFLLVGLVGLIVASLINAFWPSGPMGLAISALGVLIFAGLTAYDTQKIKSMYFVVAGNGEAAAKTAVMGALALYLDFINMFLFLLRFMGDRR
ncbi:MAG: Bax inhibitor-1/YccA family protein [Alphaproteobacteria bacterium]|nr:Bax inhibitor-1/YccA family protein [Alphaproteobacteria bacterium]MBV9370688.1 Bax inhibitor-1/YccA family protein [Alphaproteobacteria bacterium]MBV9899971.1 Bax inhibitor-1/YccA family protein [Alphaproteobacteria bacterium]